MGPVVSWIAIRVCHVEELYQSLNGKTLAYTHEQLFTVFVVFDILCYISALQFFPKKMQGTYLSPQFFVEFLENQL